MRRRNEIGYLRRLVATNLAASFALRAAFWMQVAFMALNNLLFFTFWWVLFTRFDSIRGWAIEDVAVLFGISATGYGLGAVLAGGLLDLARQIDSGELDPLLTQPKSVLVQALASRTRPDGWGDILSGLGLVALSGYVSWWNLPLVLLGVLLAALMFTFTGVLLQSSAFWWGKTESMARQYWEFMLTFSLYPPPLFGGALRFLLFTIIPAGFVSYLPVQLLREFSWPTLFAAVGGVSVYVTLALLTFHRGLGRYESGNRFGVRG